LGLQANTKNCKKTRNFERTWSKLRLYCHLFRTMPALLKISIIGTSRIRARWLLVCSRSWTNNSASLAKLEKRIFRTTISSKRGTTLNLMWFASIVKNLFPTYSRATKRIRWYSSILSRKNREKILREFLRGLKKGKLMKNLRNFALID
jgi:hypothetical protein